MKKNNYLSNFAFTCIGRWLKVVVLLLMGVLTSQHGYGQSAANYTFATNTTGSLVLDMNGNATDMSTGTTSLIGPGNDDFSSSVVNIGFTFQLMGKQYTQFSVNSNGVVGLGSTVVGTGGTGLGNATTPVIAAFGGDQATVTLASVNSKVHYKLFGTAPNRILVIEWANMKLDFSSYATATAGNGTYQVLLYETTGVVELKYGAMSVATTFSTGPAIGFSAGTTAGSIASITSSSNAIATSGTAWVNNTYALGAIANLNSSSNGSRRVYRFTPKIAPNMTGSLTFSSVGSAGMTLNWTDVTGETGYYIYRSTDGVNYTLVNTNAASAVTYAATGLTPLTTYYWQVVPITEGTVGTGLSASQATGAPVTYYWVGATGGTWSTAANWNTLANGTGTTRSTASTTDVLIVDGAGTTAGAATVINMDNAFTIGALRVTSNTTLTLQSSTTTARALTLSGGTNSFVIESGSTLNLNNAANAASIAFSGTGNTGDISGTLTFGGSASNIVTTTGGTSTVVTVSSTGIVNLGVASTISLVGSTSTLVFANGSNCNASGSTTGAPSVPLATWGATSNLTITGITSSTVTATNNVQSFGNVTYNCASATGTMSFWTTSTTVVVKGNLNIVATGTGRFRALTNGTLTVNGNLNISGGTFETFSGAGTFIVLGNVNVSGGTMDIASGAGTLRVAGNFVHTAGTVLQSTANGILEFNGTSAQTLTLVSGSHGTNTISMRINNATGVTTSSAISLRNLTVSSGNLTGSGSLAYATTSTLTYNSSTGSQTVSSIEFPTANGPGSLVINNSTASPNNIVTLPFSVSLAGTAGTLTLTAGILDNTGYVLTIPNTAVAAISGASATKYVKGAIARNLPASYSTASTYTFPVGKGSYNPFELVNPVTNAGGTVTVQAEVVDANSGGTIGSTLSAINTNRYWAASITAGSSNFTSSLIKLNDTPGSADAIASSSSLTGTYNRVGGGTATITSSAITTSAPAATTLSGFYVLANKSLATLSNLAISPTGNQCTNVSRAVTITVTPGGTAISGVAINYSLNGVAQSAIAMTNTSGDDWSGTIPTVSPANATVAWTVVATDASGLTQSLAGTGYKDAPITGFTPTASASPSAICSGSSTTLRSEILGAGLVTLGNAATLTSATNQPTAFCNRFGGYRSQAVYTASELVAAGLRAGNITSMAYNITTGGDALTNSGFVVKIGTTTLSTLSTTFESVTNFTTVYPSQTYTHTASGLQTITFSTPYNWDGVSNIIIDVIHNGANATNNSITYYTATSGNTVLTATTTSASTGTQSTQRLNLILNGTIGLTPTSISWSDGLSTIGSGSSLVVSPTSATTYTSSIIYSGCTYTPSTTVTVNALPSAPSVTNGDQCGTAIPTTTTITSTTGNSSPIFRWYSAATGGTALQSATTNYYNTSISNTTTFYVSEFNGTCESVRSAVTATFVAPPALTVTTNKAIVCNNSVAELSVTSTLSDFDSYVWSPATNLFQSDLTTPYTSGAVAYLKTTTSGSVNYTCSASNSSTSCINSASVAVTVQPASASVAPASTVTYCSTGSTTISVTPSTGYASGSLQWQSSLNGTTYADINLATSTSLSTGTITQTTFYQLVVKDGAGATCLNPSTSVVVNNPSVASTTPASRCGTGTVTLGATLGGNANALNWYAASSGGAILGTGSSFTTPSISTTTTYYVAASTGASTFNAGRLTPASTTNTTASSYGLVFDVTTAFTLNSVDVYNAGAAGTMSIQLQNSSGTVLQSLTTPTIPAGTGTTATTINLGWSIPVGTGYRLMAISSPSLVREASIIGFPYAIGTVGSITSGYLTGTNTTYYYFYNWSVTTGCQSARTAVVATVNSSPTATASASSTTFCAGQSTNLSSVFYKPGSVAIGSGTGTHSASSSIGAAFGSYYGNGHAQVLILASELTAAGLGPGNLTGMSVNVISTGSPASLTNYTLKIGASSATAISSFQVSTFTTVFTSASYTPTVGTNTITFSTPYNWNGTSNILVDYCFANSVTGSSSAVNNITTTTFGSFVNYAADGSAGAGACTNTTITNTSSNRPNLTFFGQRNTVMSSYDWSDGTSTVGTTASITTTPTGNTNYTVTGTDAGGCTATASTSVTVNALPSSPSVTNGTQCGTAIPTSTTVTSTTGSSSPIFRWYDAASGGTALQSATTNYYNTSISNTTTFYVSEFNGTCESVRSAVTATFVTPPTFTVATSNAVVCNNSVAELSVTSTISDFDSYVWSPATNLYQSDLTTPYTSGAVAYLKTTTAGSVNYTCSASNSSTSCINSASVTVAVQPATATIGAATSSALCSSGSTTISVTPSTGFANGYLQWQSSLDGTSYADINLATSTSISTGVISQTTYYQLLVKDGAGATCLTSSTSVVVNNPLVTSTTPAARCAAGTVTLGATFGGNANALKWYSASSGGAVLGTGTSFTTPSISTTTTYYVAASTASSTINAGRLTLASTTNIAASNYGLVFDATAPFTLNTVDVYNAGAAGTMSIQLQSSTGAVLQSLTTPTIPAGTGTTATTINIGWSIPVGTGYRLMAISSPALVREVSIIGFPYSIGTVGSITSGYQTSANTTYYYFYNWSVSTGCESARTAVVATVNAPPSITTTVDSDTLCAGQSTILSVSSSNTDYTYTWNGGLGTTSSVNVTPSSTTSYTVTANDNSTGPNSGCYVTSSPILVTVNPVPTSVTATASSATACAGSSINLTGAGASGMPQLNYTQGFESWPPTDWTFINAGSGNQWASGIVSRTGFGGMFYTYSTTAAANAWAITNGQTLYAGTTYTISFWYKVSSSSYPEKLRVTVGSVATVAGQSTILWSNNGANNISNTTYAQGTMTYTPATSGTYYFGFQCYSGRDQAYLYIDDVSITSGGSLPTFAWTSSPSGFTSSVQSPSNVVVNQNTTYTLIATNGYGCTSSASQTVTVTAVKPKLSISDTTLCSPNSLTISVADTGIYSSGYPSGTTVEWLGYGITGPVATTTISTNSGSSYQAKVTAGGTGCIGLSNIVTVTTRSIVMNSTIKPASCGLDNGKVVVTANSVNPPYRFIWKDNSNAIIRDTITSNNYDSIVNLAAGNYTLDVFDNNGATISCQSTTFNYTVGSAPAPSLNVTSNNISCNGLSDGTAGVNVTSGSAPYSYLWNAGSSYTTNSIFGLSVGTYTVTVTDVNGCTSQDSVALSSPSLISVSGITTSSCSNTTNGSITLTVSGGTGTKEIKWYNSNAVLIATGVNPLTNIASGTYYALITDANNCQKTEEYTVGSINAPLTNLYAEACGSYQLPWGQVATTTGVYSYSYASYLGCDSIVNYDVVITPLTTNTSNITACVTYTWAVNNQTYTVSGNYSVVTGCHTELLNLTVLPIPSQPVLACYETATYNSVTCQYDITGTQPTAPTGLACYETATFNTSTCVWDVSGTQPTMPTLACYETATFNTSTCVWDVTGTQPAAPTVACYETATFNSSTCVWDVTGTQPAAPTGLACYETATFNTSTCVWDVSGTQPAMPTLACYETATFNTTSCTWDVTGSQPAAPSGLACYETANFNSTSCAWDVTGSQPSQPTLACYETASFNTTSCTWDVTGSQPAAPSGLACYETATFNSSTCVWDVIGSQPAAPTVACYESATFNSSTCVWDVTGTQPTAPTGLACYETATFNTATCVWDVSGTQPSIPTLACYESATFNTTTCVWDVSGTQPSMPTLACYETASFNTTSCTWDVTGSQPSQPTLACYETASFNTTTCTWDVTGSIPTIPTLACYETASFNTTTCTWDVTGTPVLANAGGDAMTCGGSYSVYNLLYQNATGSGGTVSWSSTGNGWFQYLTGSGPYTDLSPLYHVGSSDIINGSATLTLTVTGANGCVATSSFLLTLVTPPVAIIDPSVVNTGGELHVCAGGSYSFSNAVVTTGSSIYWSAGSGDGSFDNNSIQNPIYTPGPQDIINGNVYIHLNVMSFDGTTMCDNMVDINLVIDPAPAMPTLACYETANFNATTCSWVVTGTQPTAPTGLACYETANFNTSTCQWVISGTQPVMPILACYETANFNSSTCVWDVTGSQPAAPSVACYETATFNSTSCQWDVTGSQPAAPSVACYETATFNSSTCVWDVTGTQPAAPTVACYETATFNSSTCVWDVTGSSASPIVTTTSVCSSYTWSANGQSYTQSGTYNYNSNCQDYTLNLTVANVSISSLVPSSGTVGSTVVIGGNGFTGATGVSFNGTSATSFTVNSNSQITATVPVGATTGAITVVVGQCSAISSGNFTVGTNATLNLKAFIQGYYAGSGTMTSVLSNQGVSTNSNEVDTVTVELRDAATGTNVVASAKGVILTDGTVSLSLPASVVGNDYYIVVKHRNTVQTWSADVVTIGTITAFDFTTAALKAFGDNLIEVETGVFAMYTGDINQDEFVDPFDYPAFELDNFSFAGGYLSTDLNGDGFIDPFDYPVFELNNFNFVMSAHP